MPKRNTPILDAARADGEHLLATTLIAHLGSDRRAEAMLADLLLIWERSSDFEPDLPAAARERACRRAALATALTLVEAGLAGSAEDPR